MRSTHICFRPSFDGVTRINFRFQLLVTLSSVHGLVASSHEIWCRYLYPIRSYWYFSKIKDGGRRHLGFLVYVNLAIPACWYCGICVLYQMRFKYLISSLRSTQICFKPSFDDVTRINFRFRLLVTSSSPRPRDASSHIIWCKISLSSSKLLRFFPEIQDGGHRHIGFSIYVNLAIPTCW